jgi:hypothetical protein
LMDSRPALPARCLLSRATFCQIRHLRGDLGVRICMASGVRGAFESRGKISYLCS